MYQKIHHVECVEITLNPKETTLPLRVKIPENAITEGVLFFSSTEDKVILSPFTGKMVAQLPEMDDLIMELNLFDRNGRQILHNLSFKNELITTENDDHIPFFINKIIDFQRSFISYSVREMKGDPASCLMYIFYRLESETEHERNVTTTENSVSFEFKVSNSTQDISLTEITGKILEGIKIKRIEIIENKSGGNLGYFTIRTKDNLTLKYLPKTFFKKLMFNQFIFNGIEIDSENSFYHNRAFGYDASPATLVFHY